MKKLFLTMVILLLSLGSNLMYSQDSSFCMRIESRTIELDTNNSSIKVFYWIKSYDSISFDSVFLTVGYPLVAETIGFNHEVAFLSSSYIKSIVNLDIIGVDSIRDVNRQHKVDRS